MSGSGRWVTFWTAVGAIGSVVAIFVGTQPPDEVDPPSPPYPGPLVATTAVAPPTTASRCDCIAIVDTGGTPAPVLGSPSLDSFIVTEVDNGREVRVLCTEEGDTATWGGKTSSQWDKVQGGYIPHVLLDTTDQIQVPSC